MIDCAHTIEVTPQKWASLKSLFEQASELDGPEQEKFISAVKETDPGLAQELISLLRGAEEDSVFHSPLTNAGGHSLPPRTRVLGQGDVVAERFQIEEFLGSGGMGEVYRAYDKLSCDQVGIKTLRAEYAAQPEFLKRLMREMRLARRIQHPNICRVFDAQCASGPLGNTMIFLIMEFLDGETLESRIRRGPLPANAAIAVAFQIIDGLQAAHEAGIIHRDLKAANVMLVPSSGGDRAVIMDFGLARDRMPRADEGRSLFDTGVIVGTAAYMAPEQLHGQSITTAVDIHALGVILFELVTARQPFEGGTPFAIALRRLNNSAPSPGKFVKKLDPNWEAATLACLESDPARRPANPIAVRAILEGVGPRRTSVSRRHLLWKAGGGGLAAALAVKYWPRPRGRSAQAEHHFKVGEEFVRRRSAEDLNNAITEYGQAIAIDPDYADAWAGLADAWAAIANFSLGNSATALKNSRHAAEEAVRLKPNSARAVGMLGYCISIDLNDWTRAENYLIRAIQLDPKRAESRLWYGAFLGKSGRSQEAIRQLLAGLDEEPTSLALNQQLSTEYLRSAEYQKALEVANELVRLQPFQALGYLVRTRAYEYLGRYADGLASCDQATKYMTGPIVESYRACVLAARGDRAEALQIAMALEEQWKHDAFDSSLLAKIFARAGDSRRALQILKVGASRNEPSLLSNILDPAFRPLFDDPEFIQFLRTLHLDPAVLKAYRQSN